MLVAAVRETGGVTTILRPGREGLLQAQLTFAVGYANESLPLRGITHLIEHLAMFAARDTPLEVNAAVDLETTNFVASGTPHLVVRFLREVCTALRALPVDRLAVEKGVLEAERNVECHQIVARLLARRYGAQYAGLVLFAGPGVAALSADQVLGFARAWYVAGNAVLHLTGSFPEGLDLPLLPGVPPDRNRPVGRVDSGPVVVTAEDQHHTGAGVIMRLPPDTAAYVRAHVIEVLRMRIQDACRYRAGHSYTIDFEIVAAVDGVDVVIYADSRPGKETAVAQAVTKAVQDLATNGPLPDEALRSVQALQERWSAAHATAHTQLRQAMYRILRLSEPPPNDPTKIAAVDPVEIQVALAAALPTAIFCIAPQALAPLEDQLRHVPVCATVDVLPSGHVFKPGIVARTLDRDERGARLVRTPTGLAEADQEGNHVIDFDNIVGVMMRTQDSCAVVIGRNEVQDRARRPPLPRIKRSSPGDSD